MKKISVSFTIAVLISIILVVIGFSLGLPIWNNGWSLDIVDLSGIPLVIWLIIFKIIKR